jgi:hypothetical protein
MIEPYITIQFDDNGRVRQPGEALAGRYRVHGVSPLEAKAVEVSVLWHTDGKGDEDLAVHHFERAAAEDHRPLDLRRPRRFRTVLPASPLSYRGAIIRIEWCVRVRVFLFSGKEVVGQRVFQLGGVPALRPAPARERHETSTPRAEADLDAALPI